MPGVCSPPRRVRVSRFLTPVAPLRLPPVSLSYSGPPFLPSSLPFPHNRVSRLIRTSQRCRLAADAKRRGEAAVGCPIDSPGSTAAAASAGARETAQARRTATARSAERGALVSLAGGHRGCLVLRAVREATTASEQLVCASQQCDGQASLAAAPEVGLSFPSLPFPFLSFRSLFMRHDAYGTGHAAERFGTISFFANHQKLERRVEWDHFVQWLNG